MEDVIAYPGGSRTVFTATTEQTAGAYVEIEVTHPRRTAAPPMHRHPSQREDFTVLAGVMTAIIDDVEAEHAAGEEFTVPVGALHSMWNDTDEPVVLRWRITPALRTEQMFRALHAAAAAADFAPDPERGPSVLAGFADEYEPA